MGYIGNLVILGIYMMLEIKFDEQIRASLKWKAEEEATKLMHSFWQTAGRFVVIIAIIWNGDNEPNHMIALAALVMYIIFYSVTFDTIFAAGVLKENPWFLGTTSIPDKLVPVKFHLAVWILKLIALAASILWVLKLSQ